MHFKFYLSKTPRKKSGQEEAEASDLRSLRMFLREICDRLLSERKFRVFAMPAKMIGNDDEGAEMLSGCDLSLLLRGVNSFAYQSIPQLVDAVELIGERLKVLFLFNLPCFEKKKQRR